MSEIKREKIKQKLTKEEQETTITWDRSNPTAEIYTHDPRMKRTIRVLSEQFPTLFNIFDDDEEWGNISCTFPSILVTIRKPRELSEAAKERLKEQGKKLAQKKRLEEGL